jgi:hypothetical protein
LLLGSFGAYRVFLFEESLLMAQYVREAPYDGQDGLSAYAGGLLAGAWTWVGLFLLVLWLGRLFSKRAKSR